MGSLDGAVQREMEGERKGAYDRPLKEEPPQFHYFATPNSTTIGTVMVMIFYHMLPFTTIPNFSLVYFAYYLYTRSKYVGFTAYMGLLLLLLVIPPYYSKGVRRRVRVLYEALAVYLPSAKYIVSGTVMRAREKGYIFAIHPHGRMFYANAMFSQLHEIWRTSLGLTQGDLFQTAAGGFFNVPIARNWFYIIGIMPASKKNIVEKLRNKDHVTIAVGGVREVCLGTSDDVDKLYLKKRRGFLQIAMDEGAGVVPVYAFNENQLFKHDPQVVLNFWQRVNNCVKIGVPFMRGMFNLPIPYRKDLLLVFGDALFAKEGETIEQFHERYMESLRQIFDKYVKFSPDPNHKLIVM